MPPSLLAAVGLLTYTFLFFVCVGGSITAGVLARRWNRQMLVATDVTTFQGLENKFNQALVACAGLVTFTLVLLAFVPTVLRDLKVWP